MSTSNDPLWLLVAMAINSAQTPRDGAAAVLRVIADEVVPDNEKPCGIWGMVAEGARTEVRQHLLEEADRAEAEQ